jgi:hypothetical protein
MNPVLQDHVQSAKPFPRSCPECPSISDIEGHWKWQAIKTLNYGGRWICRVKNKKDQKRYRDKRKQDPARYSKHQEYMKTHGIAKTFHYRVGAYKSEDKRKGFSDPTLSVVEATPMMEKPCTYCEISTSGGLDRIDNTRGHSIDNVVPCCVKCNGILIDLPYAAKIMLGAGLKEARLAGHLDNWLPPQLRKNGVRT